MSLPVHSAVVKPIDALFPDLENVRVHPERNLEALDFSLKRWGQLKNVVALASGRIVAGNGTWARMKALGATEIAVVEFTDEDDARAFAIADNRTSDLSEFDPQRLGPQLVALRDELGLDPVSLGFSAEELSAMLPPLEPLGPAGESALPASGEDPLARWGVMPGDLWAAGDHRLIVADARVGPTYDRLLEGKLASVVVTSPPYADRRPYDPASGFRCIHPDRYGLWFEPAAGLIGAHLAPDGSFLLNLKEHTTDGRRELYVKDLVQVMCRQWGWMLVDEFCWRDARNGVPGAWPNRFKNAWEPVYHFARSAGIKFRPAAVSSSSVYGPITHTPLGSFTATGARPGGGGMALPSNVIEAASEGAVDHPAPFPVGLPAFFIAAFSDPGDAILDPFMGAGTTLVAAQHAGRSGFGADVSPLYAAVALSRLAHLGLDPYRISAGDAE